MNNPFDNLEARLASIETQLETLNSQPIFGTTQTPKFFSSTEAADFLGISVQTLYNYTSQGFIPHMKRGKLLYFSEADLMAWLEETRKGGKPEIGPSKKRG